MHLNFPGLLLRLQLGQSWSSSGTNPGAATCRKVQVKQAGCENSALTHGAISWGAGCGDGGDWVPPPSHFPAASLP